MWNLHVDPPLEAQNLTIPGLIGRPGDLDKWQFVIEGTVEVCHMQGLCLYDITFDDSAKTSVPAYGIDLKGKAGLTTHGPRVDAMAFMIPSSERRVESMCGATKRLLFLGPQFRT